MTRAVGPKLERRTLLRIYLYVFGLAHLVANPILPLFGDHLLWSPRNIPTEIMMSGIYVAMSVVMLLSAKEPEKHKAFVDFVILANVVHGIIMLVLAQNVAHLVDAAVVGLTGVLPLFFYPWGLKNLLRQ